MFVQLGANELPPYIYLPHFLKVLTWYLITIYSIHSIRYGWQFRQSGQVSTANLSPTHDYQQVGTGGTCTLAYESGGIATP